MSVRTQPHPAPVDVTVYPVEEKLGEELLQRLIVEMLRPLVERWLAERGIEALTGADQFVYWRQGDAQRRVAPDVYVLPGVPAGRCIRSWKTWEEGIVPSLAVEIVSADFQKDYLDAPARYRELGVRELVIFDPHWDEKPDRWRFQVHRQVEDRGLVLVAATNDRLVPSDVLGCHLVAVGTGDATRLRLGTGPDGAVLFPTEAERERIAREAAEAELARLRARSGS